MTSSGARDFYVETARSRVTGYTRFFKYGYNAAVSTTLVPICAGGFYRTPTAATALELVSTSTDDAAAGTGAQQVTIVYLDGTGAEQTQTVETNGTTAVPLTSDCLRIYRWYVSRSGSYATQAVPSQVGALTIQETGGGDVWSTIPTIVTGFGAGQSLIGAYTVPLGKELVILGAGVTAEATKSVDLYLFQRDNILDVTTPFTGTMRIQNVYKGLANSVEFSLYKRFDELTDVGWMARVSTPSAAVAIDYWGVLIDKV